MNVNYNVNVKNLVLSKQQNYKIVDDYSPYS